MELIEGLVLEVLGIHWVVMTKKGAFRCVIRKVLIKREGSPIVGDNVLLEIITSDTGRICEILPRKTVLKRPDVHKGTKEQLLAANIDQLVIVASLYEPTLKTGLIDRYIVAAWKEGLYPIVCINKIDMIYEEEISEIKEHFKYLDIPLVFTSATTKKGIKELLSCLYGHISVFVGHSGVGKTSIVSILLEDYTLSTKAVSVSTGKGRHVTTAPRMFLLPNGNEKDSTKTYLVDLPGHRAFGLSGVSEKDVIRGFPEISDLPSCLMPLCTHQNEEGCFITDLVKRGLFSEERLIAFLRIMSSLNNTSY